MREDRFQKATLYFHILDLRKRLIIWLISVIILSIISYVFRDFIFIRLTKDLGLPLYFNSLQGAFVLMIKISMISGLILSIPILLYEAWAFAASALKKNERRILLYYLPISVILFFFGAAFCYLLVIPTAIKFLLSFSTESLKPLLGAGEFLSFFVMLLLCFGFVFELPLAMRFITTMSIIDKNWFRKNRPYAIVIFLIVAGMITPPDAFTQIVMAIPMILLFEAGILISG